MNNLTEFCTHIKYQFRDQSLLNQALTHPSLSGKIENNYQRLEFLGDKVLNLVIGESLIKEFQKEPEGDLSKRQACLVSGESLAEIALAIGLDKVLQVSYGEKKLGGTTNKRNLENSLEALIGAIYLDSDYQSAQKFILEFWSENLKRNILPPKDPVSLLQELVQSQSKQLPQYFTEQSGGSDHSPLFTATVKIIHKNLEFSAKGKSKKEAQKEVSRIAFETLLQGA